MAIIKSQVEIKRLKLSFSLIKRIKIKKLFSRFFWYNNSTSVVFFLSLHAEVLSLCSHFLRRRYHRHNTRLSLSRFSLSISSRFAMLGFHYFTDKCKHLWFRVCDLKCFTHSSLKDSGEMQISIYHIKETSSVSHTCIFDFRHVLLFRLWWITRLLTIE
jgi:hypothetical protein